MFCSVESLLCEKGTCFIVSYCTHVAIRKFSWVQIFVEMPPGPPEEIFMVFILWGEPIVRTTPYSLILCATMVNFFFFRCSRSSQRKPQKNCTW